MEKGKQVCLYVVGLQKRRMERMERNEEWTTPLPSFETYARLERSGVVGALGSDGAEFSLRVTAKKHLTLSEIDFLHPAGGREKTRK